MVMTKLTKKQLQSVEEAVMKANSLFPQEEFD